MARATLSARSGIGCGGHTVWLSGDRADICGRLGNLSLGRDELPSGTAFRLAATLTTDFACGVNAPWPSEIVAEAAEMREILRSAAPEVWIAEQSPTRRDFCPAFGTAPTR